VLEVEGFVRPQACIHHEQHEVINLFGIFARLLLGLN
jgi:hypothetical protein